MHCNVHLLHIPKQKQVGILLLLHFETSGSCLQSIYSLVCIKYIYTKLFSWFSIVRDEQKFFISGTQVIRTISVFFFKINDFFLMTSKQSYQAKNPTTFPRRLDSWVFFFKSQTEVCFPDLISYLISYLFFRILNALQLRNTFTT